MQFKASLIAFAALFAVSNASPANLEARQHQSGVIRACTEPNFEGYCEDITVWAFNCANLSPELVAGGVQSVSLSAPEYFYCLLDTETFCPVSSQLGVVIPAYAYSTLPTGWDDKIVSIRCTCTDGGPC